MVVYRAVKQYREDSVFIFDFSAPPTERHFGNERRGIGWLLGSERPGVRARSEKLITDADGKEVAPINRLTASLPRSGMASQLCCSKEGELIETRVNRGLSASCRRQCSHNGSCAPGRTQAFRAGENGSIPLLAVTPVRRSVSSLFGVSLPSLLDIAPSRRSCRLTDIRSGYNLSAMRARSTKPGFCVAKNVFGFRNASAFLCPNHAPGPRDDALLPACGATIMIRYSRHGQASTGKPLLTVAQLIALRRWALSTYCHARLDNAVAVKEMSISTGGRDRRLLRRRWRIPAGPRWRRLSAAEPATYDRR